MHNRNSRLAFRDDRGVTIMRLLAFLTVVSIAILAPWTASADDSGSRSGWVRIETDKGCIAYLAGTPEFYTTKAYRWSESCIAGQPIAGTGRLAMYMEGKVWVQTGRFVDGYFEDLVTEEKFVVVDGKWDDRTSVKTTWKYLAKGGCFYTADQYQNPDWQGCVPRGGARAVRAPRRVFAAVSVNTTPMTAAKPFPAPTSPGTGSYTVDNRSAPGGVSVSGPDRTGESTVASPQIGATSPPAGSKSGSGAGGPAAAATPPRAAGDFTPVSDCIAMGTGGLYGSFVNKCGFKVMYTYCVLSPKKGAWSEAFTCEKQQFGTDWVGANSTSGAHNRGGVTTYWFACRYPQLAVAKYERGRGAAGVCK